LSRASIERQVQVVLEENVPVLVAGLGDPAAIIGPAHEAHTLVMGIVGNPRHAARQLSAGVDVLIGQGHEAGGHTGAISTFPLVPQLVAMAGSTPVVAAGGIASGRGILAALALGAQGAWIGTAFLFAEE